jgi:NADH-quinone oxidoreductase subunit H
MLLVISFVVDLLRDRGERAAAEEQRAAGEEEFDPMAGGFPVPPKPGQSLPPVPRRPSRMDRPAATATADAPEASDVRDGRKEDGDA